MTLGKLPFSKGYSYIKIGTPNFYIKMGTLGSLIGWGGGVEISRISNKAGKRGGAWGEEGGEGLK